MRDKYNNFKNKFKLLKLESAAPVTQKAADEQDLTTKLVPR